jgi:Icc-related predicted phosphoesterase
VREEVEACLALGHVDVLLTHAPPRGAGDREDPAHQGFEALNRLVGRLQPPLLLHGHIHPYGEPVRAHRIGPTIVRNVVGRHLLDIEPGGGARRSPAGALHAG